MDTNTCTITAPGETTATGTIWIKAGFVRWNVLFIKSEAIKSVQASGQPQLKKIMLL